MTVRSRSPALGAILCLSLAACGSSAPTHPAGLPVGPLTTRLNAPYAPVTSVSGRGSRTIHTLRLTGHVQLVGSCTGGRKMSVAFGAVRGEIFCNGTDVSGAIANRIHGSASTLVISATPRVRWALLVGNHS